MAFVQAMNDSLKKVGINGADVYTEDGVGDYRVTLFTMLNRDLEELYLKKHIDCIFSLNDPIIFRDLFVMAFQTRDIRGGKGEKKLFYNFIKYLYEYDSDTTLRLLSLVPEYGCWRDLWELVKIVPDFEFEIIKIVNKTFKNDMEYYNKNEYNKMTLLAKWLPREGSRYSELAKVFANNLYDFKSMRKRIVQYRKDVSLLNKALKTVEIYMCDKSWYDIKPESVPGRCLKLHTKAFLNEPNTKMMKKTYSLLRYPDDMDRMLCREHFLDFIENMKKGKVKAHGANVVMPHELVNSFISMRRFITKSEEEKDIIQGQWNSIREETMKLGGLNKCIPMCDFSGSMNGIPKLISLSLGILISEINHDAFKDYILTFDSTPVWHSFKGCSTLENKLKVIDNFLGHGLNTNFYKACMFILDKMIEYKVPVGEEPEDLIVLTDMGFDGANNSNEIWESQLEKIQNEFKIAGEKIWGEGNGWKVPRIVIWNLRAEYKDFHATAHQEGVVQLSGWSPSMLKALQTNGVKVMTPYEGMRYILDDSRYEPIRHIFNNIYF
jgi:hypothetical protein